MALTTRLKQKSCKECGCSFMQTSPMQSVCSRQCATARSKAKAQAKPRKGFGRSKPEPEHAHIIDGDERFVEQTEDRHAARAARQMAAAKETRELITKVGLVALVSKDEPECAPIEKENPLRSEPYRRLVAALPCMWCGRPGRSNHAHENSGKGKSMKVDDRRAMPLCVDDLGQHGCHTAFDQYALIDGGKEAHAELGRAMAARTRKIILDAGKWPKALPLWKEDQPHDV